MACPFFMPAEKLENGLWPHASRLPLGCGWSGRCTAPGHEDEAPSQEELRELCNLGYAASCSRLPQERIWDSVRFAAVSGSLRNGPGRRIELRYVCERDHRPASHGVLAFNVETACWEQSHRDRRVQRMAECFLASYLEKRRQDVAQAGS